MNHYDRQSIMGGSPTTKVNHHYNPFTANICLYSRILPTPRRYICSQCYSDTIRIPRTKYIFLAELFYKQSRPLPDPLHLLPKPVYHLLANIFVIEQLYSKYIALTLMYDRQNDTKESGIMQ